MKVGDCAKWSGYFDTIVKIEQITSTYILVNMKGVNYLAYEHELELLTKFKADKKRK